MLRELRIRNFAIIDDLALEFRDGLTVLTGETGAGKSILVDAVELLVGGKSSPDLVRTGCPEAVLEAVFSSAPAGPARDHLREMGLIESPEDEIVVRRVIPRSGKGRTYLNGGVIPAALLSQIGEKLVDIHGQHEHQSLLKSDEQLELLDAYGKLLPLRDEYRLSYEGWMSARRRLEELRRSAEDKSRVEDLLRHQREEISAAGLRPDEEEDLEKARKRLSQSDRLIRLASEAYDLLYGGEDSVQSQVSRAGKLLGELVEIDPEFADSLGAIETIRAGLDEAVQSVRSLRDGIEHEPARLEEIEERIHLIGQLRKKYGPTLAEVIDSLGEVERELSELENRGERMETLAREAALHQAKAKDLAGRLGRERKRVSVSLKKEVENGLKPLGMEQARFEARLIPAGGEDGLTGWGAERVDFLIAPNPGEEARLISRTASGGELSRIMLAIKAILSEVDPVPTLIFDEVDAGIGGGVASVVGERLGGLARRRQVLCITHLPQIAACAGTHFSVEKQTNGGRTITQVVPLEKEERVDEIARMLGGKNVTPVAVKHARELLENAGPAA